MINDQRQTQQVYLACAPTDMRKSINGLVVLVKEVFELDPFSPSWFVFCNRQHDKIKILRWDTWCELFYADMGIESKWLFICV